MEPFGLIYQTVKGCSPVFELRYITLQPQVKLLCLREKLPEQQHIGVSCVDKLHLHLAPNHRLQPIQHFPHFVHSKGLIYQSWQTSNTRIYSLLHKPSSEGLTVWCSCHRKSDDFYFKGGSIEIDWKGHLLSLSSSKHESIVFSLRTLFERANLM